MILFLTSSPGGHIWENGHIISCPLDSSNGFLDELKECWTDDAVCLLISSDPDNIVMNDSMRENFTDAFSMSGLSVSEIHICDSRNPKMDAEYLERFDFVILSGGHVPTENAFFRKIKLSEAIKGYNGVVIGISAGTMNCAKTVYAMPELEGESLNPHYQRFIAGLGLTEYMIIPHYQYLQGVILDGKKAIEEIACPDSEGRSFYGLYDGSYIVVRDGKTTLHGEACLIEDGAIKTICAKGESKEL